MTPPRSPRLKFAREHADRFILGQGIDNLPVNPFALIEKNCWGLVTYSSLCQTIGQGTTAADIVETCKSGDGFTIYNGRNFCIAYNDLVSVKSRIRFTLMHEIGHIVCGHFTDFRASSLSPSQYAVLEEEANYFASCVLAPSSVVKRCGLDTQCSLRCACAISKEAAARRLSQLEVSRTSRFDAAILKQFDAYIKYNCRSRAHNVNIDICVGH